MIVICNNCGAVFDDDELEYERECVGECWGQPAYQEVAIPPCCNELDYRPARCEDCYYAEPYMPDVYEDAFVCKKDGEKRDGYETACSCFDLKEEEE